MPPRKQQFTSVKREPLGYSGSSSKRKENEEKQMLCQVEEVLRIHHLSVAGNGKMDMVPQRGLQQGRGAHIADGLTQRYGLANGDGGFR